MTDWSWEYDPDETLVSGGLPVGVTAEVERVATELAALGPDAETAGRPEGRVGGLRECDIFGGQGFITFLAIARHRRVYVTRITCL
ncbi:hypothetical protein ACFY41_25220 [Streptomyces syringium]|uniref:hypothetical protein n=1 Tax=Streptomyces syringium TaxID=76729 RepID=UPI0036C029D7